MEINYINKLSIWKILSLNWTQNKITKLKIKRVTFKIFAWQYFSFIFIKTSAIDCKHAIKKILPIKTINFRIKKAAHITYVWFFIFYRWAQIIFYSILTHDHSKLYLPAFSFSDSGTVEISLLLTSFFEIIFWLSLKVMVE